MRFHLIRTCRIVTCALVVLMYRVTVPCQKPELITEEGHTSVVRTIAFSPNGNLIASGSEDKKIKLWNVEAGMEFRSMGGNGGEVNSLFFFDNYSLQSEDGDGPIKDTDTNTREQAG